MQAAACLFTALIRPRASMSVGTVSDAGGAGIHRGHREPKLFGPGKASDLPTAELVAN
jgi:hypothetical protein